MKPSKQTIIQYNWCPHKKNQRRLGHRIHAQRKSPVRTQEEGTISKPRREPSEETVGEEILSQQDMPLWHFDYFKELQT